MGGIEGPRKDPESVPELLLVTKADPNWGGDFYERASPGEMKVVTYAPFRAKLALNNQQHTVSIASCQELGWLCWGTSSAHLCCTRSRTATPDCSH